MTTRIVRFLDEIDQFGAYAQDKATGGAFPVVDLPIREVVTRLDWLVGEAEKLMGEDLRQGFRRSYNTLHVMPHKDRADLLTVKRALRLLEQQVLEVLTAGIAAV